MRAVPLCLAALIGAIAPRMAAAAIPRDAPPAPKAGKGKLPARPKRPPPAKARSTDPTARASLDFGLRLLRELVKDVGASNLFLSPASLSSSLATPCNGASGATRAAIAAALSLGPGTEAAAESRAWQAGWDSLGDARGSGARAVAASALWIDEAVGLRPDFGGSAARAGAELRVGPLAKADTADEINRWISAKTANRLQTIVPSPLPPPTDLAVVDAVAFKASWARDFDEAQTQERPFQLPFGDPVDAPMMRQAGTLAYARFEQGQAVALPLGGGRLTLLVLLPARGIDFTAFVAGLGAARFEAIVGALKPTEGEVALPRFKVECGKDLEGALRAMGMAPAFEPGADFSAMARGPARLGHVYHRALVEISEEGGAANVATGAPPGPRRAPPGERFELVADRPFVMAVRDGETDAVLLLGALADPRG